MEEVPAVTAFRLKHLRAFSNLEEGTSTNVPSGLEDSSTLRLNRMVLISHELLSHQPMHPR